MSSAPIFVDSNANDNDENMLKVSTKRFIMRPDAPEHPDIWRLYKEAQTFDWTAEELDFSADRADWAKLNDGEKWFIKQILGFFSQADGIVNENLVGNFMEQVQYPEARAFWSFQIYIESVHAETYSLLVTSYVTDIAEQEELLNAIETIPAIKRKADWALTWINSSAPFAQRLLSTVILEGLFFQGSFAAIFWLRERGLMKGLAQANDFIARDENLHAKMAILLYSKLKNKCSEETVHRMFKSAVEAEWEFMRDALPVKLIGMNADHMKQYISFVADYLLHQLGYSCLFNLSNPFAFMENLSMPGKYNFFEARNTEYKRGGAVSIYDPSNQAYEKTSGGLVIDNDW